MGEDNRGSSGSSTAMIVIAILGGVLLVACCGGVVLVGGSLFVYRSARDMETEVMKAQESAEQARQEVE